MWANWQYQLLGMEGSDDPRGPSYGEFGRQMLEDMEVSSYAHCYYFLFRVESLLVRNQSKFRRNRVDFAALNELLVSTPVDWRCWQARIQIGG